MNCRNFIDLLKFVSSICPFQSWDLQLFCCVELCRLSFSLLTTHVYPTHYSNYIREYFYSTVYFYTIFKPNKWMKKGFKANYNLFGKKQRTKWNLTHIHVYLYQMFAQFIFSLSLVRDKRQFFLIFKLVTWWWWT